LISLNFFGCAHNLNKDGILEDRANYNSAKEKKSISKPITRTKGQVKKAWLHAHEMPTGDYFDGAWVYLLVEETKWIFPEKH
jgi:hypothetical protein